MPAALRPLAEVVGENCKRLRARIGITQDELAKYARYVGLRWRASSVGDFEAGRSERLTMTTVLAVAAALQLAIEDSGERAGQPTSGITLGDLFESDEWVSVTETLVLPGATLAQWFCGDVTKIPTLEAYSRTSGRTDKSIATDVAQIVVRSGLAEQRVAKDLGLSLDALAVASFDLWGGTFAEERDRRAGSDANKQKRGQVARAMRAELASAIEGGLS